MDVVHARVEEPLRQVPGPRRADRGAQRIWTCSLLSFSHLTSRVGLRTLGPSSAPWGRGTVGRGAQGAQRGGGGAEASAVDTRAAAGKRETIFLFRPPL